MKSELDAYIHLQYVVISNQPQPHFNGVGVTFNPDSPNMIIQNEILDSNPDRSFNLKSRSLKYKQRYNKRRKESHFKATPSRIVVEH